MVREEGGGFGSMDPKDQVKLLVTIVFLPLICFLVIHGSVTNQGAMIGVALAMISALGVFWGTPTRGGGKDE